MVSVLEVCGFVKDRWCEGKKKNKLVVGDCDVSNWVYRKLIIVSRDDVLCVVVVRVV